MLSPFLFPHLFFFFKKKGAVWNAWGPVSKAIEPEFGWSDGTVALLANWGPICYLVAVFPSSWLLDIKGLRASLLVGAALVFVGSGVRCITLRHPAATYLIHFGHVRAVVLFL